MNRLEFAGYQIVNRCLKLQAGEKFVLITDRATREIAQVILTEAKVFTPNISYFEMEDFGERSKDGTNPLPLPDKIIQAIIKADASIFAANCFPGEYASFRKPLLENYIEKSTKIRHGHMPDITKEIMEMGMNSDYLQIQKISRRVFEIVKNAKEIKVTAPGGSDFVVTFNPKHKWIIDDGTFDGERRGNLPAGEVYTCIESIKEGKIVIDGVLGDCFDVYGLLKDTPITVYIKDSRAVEIQCDNKKLLKEFSDHLKQDENSNRIGEFAIGTNIGLDRLIGNLLQDEKFPGVHVAFGSGMPNRTFANRNSNVHVDGIILCPDVVVDGKIIMTGGRFIDEILE